MDIALNPTARWNAPSQWFRFSVSQPRRTAPVARWLADPVHTLPKGTTLRVECPKGTEVACLDGSLWVTHDDEPQDHIVEPGMPYTARKASTMLVHAMADARCLVVRPSVG
jgi:Protein of unknown function (DUF2917)